MSLDRRKEVIKQIGKFYGWEFFEEQTNPPMLSFRRNGERINVYHTTMTVVTCLNHPLQGKKSLVRRDVNGKMLKAIFHNPRVHTGVGYHTKENYVKPRYPLQKNTFGASGINREYQANRDTNAGSVTTQPVLPVVKQEQPRRTPLTNFINWAAQLFRGKTGTH